MCKKVDSEVFVNSQYAIRDYIHWKVGNGYMHEAKVLVSSKGKTKYNSILQVIAKIETNNSFVNIIGDEQFEQNYYTQYTNEYQKFDFIDGTLLIKGKDRNGYPIEIKITNV